MTCDFGLAFLTDAAARIAMAYTLPLDLVPLLSVALNEAISAKPSTRTSLPALTTGTGRRWRGIMGNQGSVGSQESAGTEQVMTRLAHTLESAVGDQGRAAQDPLALQSAQEVSDERLPRAGMPGPVAALYPSLHLNPAEDHRKLCQFSGIAALRPNRRWGIM